MLSDESNQTMIESLAAKLRIERGRADLPDQRAARRRMIMLAAALLCAGFAFLIFSGIRSRIEAEKGLERKVKSSAIPVVTVIHPETGSKAQEIELPGTTE